MFDEKVNNENKTSTDYSTSRKDRIMIDHSRCQGCGSCVTSCPNGGFKVINGKSHIVNNKFCDGLGYCIQACPMDAIKFNGEILDNNDKLCKEKPFANNWPIKLQLVNIHHKQFKNADLAIIADCAPVMLKNFKELVEDRIVLIFCPKLGNIKETRDKLTRIINENSIKSIVSYNVDYICCESFPRIVKDAIRFSKKKIQLMPSYENQTICLFGTTK